MGTIWTNLGKHYEQVVKDPQYVPSMYDPEVLEREVAQLLTELLPGVDEHYVCILRDCAMIAHTACWIQRFS